MRLPIPVDDLSYALGRFFERKQAVMPRPASTCGNHAFIRQPPKMGDREAGQASQVADSDQAGKSCNHRIVHIVNCSATISPAQV